MKMKISVKKAALAAALATGTIAAGGWGYHYYTSGRFLVSTDDAYVKADTTTIAPKVSGYVSAVLVDDNQRVEAGTVLARIDDRDFQTAFDQAEADVATAKADIAEIAARIELQQANIRQAKAKVSADRAALEFARQDHARYRDLLRTGYGTAQRAQKASAEFREKSAMLERDLSAVAAAERQIEVLNTERAKAEAVLKHKTSAFEQARLNLEYTVIRAPIGGTVGARSVRVGQYVQAGTQLMAVVPLAAVYVVANFKETQLADVHSGQRASVEVDGLDGAAVAGHVDSLSPASGLEFSLLPPDNATGNFTKIVQRIPVKIAITADGPLAGRLRPGMSVTAVIDTKSRGDAPDEQDAPAVASR
jgi:membrane fusion protein (multidrug efflux system)